MEIVNWKDLPVVSNPHLIDIRQLYDHAAVQIRQVILRSGQRVRPFVSPVAALLYISRGTVVVQSGDMIQSVCGGKLVVCPADRPATLFNNSDDEALVLAIRAPKTHRKKPVALSPQILPGSSIGLAFHRSQSPCADPEA